MEECNGEDEIPTILAEQKEVRATSFFNSVSLRRMLSCAIVIPKNELITTSFTTTFNHMDRNVLINNLILSFFTHIEGFCPIWDSLGKTGDLALIDCSTDLEQFLLEMLDNGSSVHSGHFTCQSQLDFCSVIAVIALQKKLNQENYSSFINKRHVAFTVHCIKTPYCKPCVLDQIGLVYEDWARFYSTFPRRASVLKPIINMLKSNTTCNISSYAYKLLSGTGMTMVLKALDYLSEQSDPVYVRHLIGEKQPIIAKEYQMFKEWAEKIYKKYNEEEINYLRFYAPEELEKVSNKKLKHFYSFVLYSWNFPYFKSKVLNCKIPDEWLLPDPDIEPYKNSFVLIAKTPREKEVFDMLGVKCTCTYVESPQSMEANPESVTTDSKQHSALP